MTPPLIQSIEIPVRPNGAKFYLFICRYSGETGEIPQDEYFGEMDASHYDVIIHPEALAASLVLLHYSLNLLQFSGTKTTFLFKKLGR